MNLKSLRKKYNFTQKQVADELGIQVSSYSKLERGESQLTVNRLKILASFYDLPLDEMVYSKGQDEGFKTQIERRNVTYVPVAAQAGLLIDFSQHQPLEGGVQFSLPVFYEDSLLLINLEGDSMYPTFCNGDYVIVRQLGMDYQIKWGEPYLIITNDGQVVKRVMKSSSNEKLLLKSDNELYQSYEVDKSVIRTIWEVKGVISKNLAPRLLR